MLPSKLHTCRFLGNSVRVLEPVYCTNTTFYKKIQLNSLQQYQKLLFGLTFLFVVLPAFLYTSEETLSETVAAIRHLSLLFESNCRKKRQ